jgi:hypothetical protein
MKNERGSAILIVLVILVVLTLLGTVATQTTNTELKIAANDKIHRQTFYGADGATELAAELLEQNIAQVGFESDFITEIAGDITVAPITGDAFYQFWLNEDILATIPSDTNYDFQMPVGFISGEPHTNFTMGGHTEVSEGAGVPMAAGYEGLGKGSGHGGSRIVYDIYTQRVGEKNSESIVRIQWRHVN